MADVLVAAENKWFERIKKALDVTSDEKYPETLEEVIYKFKNESNKQQRNSYTARYLDYNKVAQSSTLPDKFKINNIYLTIPPESIQIYFQGKSIDVPQLRSSGVAKIETGYDDVTVTFNVKFASDTLHGTTIENELLFKYIPLITQLKTIPFCKVENEYLRHKLTGNADSKVPIMLTYLGHSTNVSPASPEIIDVNFTFTVFNYYPYMLSLGYVCSYNRSSGVINKYMDVKQVQNPEDSVPFHEMHALELDRRWKGGELRGYNHFKNNGIKISLNTYTELPANFLYPMDKQIWNFNKQEYEAEVESKDGKNTEKVMVDIAKNSGGTLKATKGVSADDIKANTRLMQKFAPIAEEAAVWIYETFKDDIDKLYNQNASENSFAKYAWPFQTLFKNKDHCRNMLLATVWRETHGQLSTGDWAPDRCNSSKAFGWFQIMEVTAVNIIKKYSKAVNDIKDWKHDDNHAGKMAMLILWDLRKVINDKDRYLPKLLPALKEMNASTTTDSNGKTRPQSDNEKIQKMLLLVQCAYMGLNGLKKVTK